MQILSCAYSQSQPGITSELAAFRKEHINDIRYELKFNIEVGKTEMKSQQKISFNWKKNNQPLEIDFKSARRNIKSMLVNNKPSKIDYRQEHIIIPAYLLKPGNNEIYIDFISNGKPVKIDTNGLAYTLFVPAKARESFPCFDQPDMKAKFLLKLTVPTNWVAVSNETIIDSSKSGKTTTFSFAETSPISTYLFAFAAGKFSRYTETRNGRTIHFYYRETNKAKLDSSLKKCMDLHFKALDFNAAYLGKSYPYSKLDFVGIPGYSVSGMEHPGAIFYDESRLMLDAPSATQEYNRAGTIGHEVSHMWFGDDVTMKWFNEVWLKEVFANYFGDRFAGSISPQNDYLKKHVLANYPSAYLIDRFPSSDPIMRFLPNLNQAGLAYGWITYNKAPIVIRQLELLIGAEAFQKGLQDYIKKYQQGNADFNQLMDEFKKYTSEDLDQWMLSWIRKPGRPIIQYHLKEKDGLIKQFSLMQEGEYESSLIWPQKFDLMFVYDSLDSRVIKVNMRTKLHEIAEAYGWKTPKLILFNSSGEGYGVFPHDDAFVQNYLWVKAPESRAAAVINMYELMLRTRLDESNENFTVGQKLGPSQLLETLSKLIELEPDQQILERELRYMEFIYWRLLKPQTRKNVNSFVESSLLKAMHKQGGANRTSVFRTFMKLAESKPALDSLYSYWHQKRLPAGISLGQGDWINLAKELAIRDYKTAEILKRQLDSIPNIDLQKSFAFQMSALSSDTHVRDSFFEYILTPRGRMNESDVTAALGWLHHPLRQSSSRKFLERALKALPEILQTSDIFFPTNWISSNLEQYQDEEAVRLLKKYLSLPHDEIPYLLMQKVKQNADLVFRAAMIAD